MRRTHAWLAAAAGAAVAAAVASAPPGQVSGQAVFEGKGLCASCHGRAGKGTPLGPSLADGEWLHGSGTLDEIREVVRAGVAKPKKHPAPMPPMGGAKLNSAELDAVARYVHGLGRAQ